MSKSIKSVSVEQLQNAIAQGIADCTEKLCTVDISAVEYIRHAGPERFTMTISVQLELPADGDSAPPPWEK